MSWQPNIPPPPSSPPPPATAAKTPSGVVYILAAVALVLVASSVTAAFVLVNRGDESATSGTGANAAPAPAATSTPSPASPADQGGRVKVAIADAHSGGYFSNDFQDTYPTAFERFFIVSVIRSSGNIASEEYLACTLSWVESQGPFSDITSSMKGRAAGQRFGLRAATACMKYAF